MTCDEMRSAYERFVAAGAGAGRGVTEAELIAMACHAAGCRPCGGHVDRRAAELNPAPTPADVLRARGAAVAVFRRALADPELSAVIDETRLPDDD